MQTRNAATAVANVDPNCKHVVMVGFGRDGDAHSVGRYRPNMTILQVQTNRDLQLPWLKEDKTDSAFTIISEPEVKLHQVDDDKIQLEVVGLNCFNPKLGVVEAGDARRIRGIMVISAAGTAVQPGYQRRLAGRSRRPGARTTWVLAMWSCHPCFLSSRPIQRYPRKGPIWATNLPRISRKAGLPDGQAEVLEVLVPVIRGYGG